MRAYRPISERSLHTNVKLWCLSVFRILANPVHRAFVPDVAAERVARVGWVRDQAAGERIIAATSAIRRGCGSLG